MARRTRPAADRPGCGGCAAAREAAARRRRNGEKEGGVSPAMPARCFSSLALPMRPPGAVTARAGRLLFAWPLGRRCAGRRETCLSDGGDLCRWPATQARHQGFGRTDACTGWPWQIGQGREGVGPIGIAARFAARVRGSRLAGLRFRWPNGDVLRKFACVQVCHELYAGVPVTCRQEYLSPPARVTDQAVVCFSQQFQFRPGVTEPH